MKITAILPVSRTKYLNRVLESLEKQTYKPNSLIVVYDGPDNKFIDVRNRIVGLEYDNVICVSSNNRFRAHTIADRRKNIVNIHNQIREIVADCDWVFSIEDDGILPADALSKLVANINVFHHHAIDVGMITGVELGRWGFPYVGAWKVDDINDPHKIVSLDNKTSSNAIEEIDGCGLYCALIRADLYKTHKFYTNNGVGPDVNLGLYLRQQGYKNYIDWSVHVTHLTHRNGGEIEICATDDSKIISLNRLSGGTWIGNR